jgi:hypothetical protein
VGVSRHRLLCGDRGRAEDVDRLLSSATVHLVNTDPPYGVRIEPRSNNAIASGLSSFKSAKHHRRFDIARHPEKAKPTNQKLRDQGPTVSQQFSWTRRTPIDSCINGSATSLASCIRVEATTGRGYSNLATFEEKKRFVKFCRFTLANQVKLSLL